MNACAVAVPDACCSAPRAVITIAVDAVPSSSATASRSAAGTPVIRSTRSGQ